MKSVSVEQPETGAIFTADNRDTLIAYLSYALQDLRMLDGKAYHLLQMTIESLGGDVEAAQTH